MKRFINVLLLIIITVFVGVFSNTVFALEVDKKISTSSIVSIPAYINGLSISVNVISDGSVCYCLNSSKTVPENTEVYLDEEKDLGLSYIIENGYPNKEITGDRNKDIYITQVAIWWYLDDVYGTTNLNNNIRNGKDTDNVIKYIKALVKSAKKEKDNNRNVSLKVSDDTKTLIMDGTKKYYVSEEISVEIKNASYYTIKFIGAPQGTYVTDSLGNKKEKFEKNEKFKVYVPRDENLFDSYFSIKVTAVDEYNKVYEYKAKDKNIQEVLSSKLYVGYKKKSKNIDFEIFKSKVSINLVDKDNNKKVTGATLILKDISGNIVTSWVSKGNTHVIENLPIGKYYVEETIAPVGYKLNKKSSSFEITDTNKNIKVNFKNTKDENKRTIVKIMTIDSNTKKPIIGAQLVILDSKNNEVLKFDSGNDYYITNELKKGTYTIKEISAPNGYIIDGNTKTFKVSDDGKTIVIEISNKAKNTLVSITGIDSNTNEVVEEITGVLKDSNGREITKFNIEDKSFTVENLEDGNYIVEILSVPEGYILEQSRYEFVIDSNNRTSQINVKCSKEMNISVPQTSSKPSIIFYVIGGIILIGTVGFIYYYEKNKEE